MVRLEHAARQFAKPTPDDLALFPTPGMLVCDFCDHEYSPYKLIKPTMREAGLTFRDQCCFRCFLRRMSRVVTPADFAPGLAVNRPYVVLVTEALGLAAKIFSSEGTPS